MTDHAPVDASGVTETPNTGTPAVKFDGLIPAAAGNSVGGPARPPAPLSEHPATGRLADRAGQGRAQNCLSSRQALRAPRTPRVRLVLDILGDLVGLACLFFILFAGLFLGDIL